MSASTCVVHIIIELAGFPAGGFDSARLVRERSFPHCLWRFLSSPFSLSLTDGFTIVLCMRHEPDSSSSC